MSAPRYRSTRDDQNTNVNFQEALLRGLAPDGGLYVPDTIPKLEPNTWQRASSLAELGLNALTPWLEDDFDQTTLRTITWDALSFPIPLIELGDGVYVLELFHGPTLSFKDVGARFMARAMSTALADRGERLTILVATSGDTGSAVADGFAGQDAIDVVLLYPKGKVSPVQERQLIAARPGVRAFAVEGDFDDCQRLVKAAFVDKALAHLPLSSANSINIGRLLPQSLYYLWAGKHLLEQHPGLTEFNVCVPSGNLGNLTGGVLAAKMGLPVKRFVAAHNANDFFPRYLRGEAEPYSFSPTTPTLSNAMDVGAPSNFERLHALLGDERLKTWVWGTSVTDEDALKRMKRSYDAHGCYVACPHTAVGLEAVARYRHETGDDTPIITLATAHPAKFPEAVERALSVTPPTAPALERLWHEDTNVETLESKPEALREVLLQLAKVR